MGARDNAVEDPKSDSAPIFLSSTDDADNDLSLKAVEKEMLSNETNTNPSASSSKPDENLTEMKKKRKKRKERKKEKMEDNAVEEEEPKDSDVTLETNPAEKSDNIVLRKLLRGPRYFDPPDNNWGNCYNCGEGGHISANCTSARRKKPCFVCGSFDHNVKQCNKGKDCFICKKGGHRAKDCPEKSIGGYQNAKICLKCGDSGHEMFSCKSAYSPDDLKEIQCYVCKCFGHLCCVNNRNAGPREVSCYRCGQLGHNGWECARVHAETTSNGPGTGTPSSCYKCGQEGHLARKCTTTSTKKEKRKNEYSTPRKSRSQSRDNHVSHDLGNPRKKNKTQFGQSTSSHSQLNNKRRSSSNSRGGWTTEDPGEWGSPPPKFQDRYKSGERSHTYNNNSNNGSGYNSGYNSNSNSNSHGRKLHYETSNGSYHHQHTHSHRYSASRFGNSSNFGKRDYNTWDY